MRQVTKTTPPVGENVGEYPYPVDVSSQPALEASLSALTMDFANFMISPDVLRMWKTTSPTALQVLNGLLLLAKPAPAGGAPPPSGGVTREDVAEIKASLTSKLDGMYGKVRMPLELQVGRFCAYCERYEGSAELEVEHICAKSVFPLFYFAWENFLFGCKMCNTRKTTRPARADLVGPTEADYFAAVKQKYLWPQWSSTAYRQLTPVPEYKDGANWLRFPSPADPRNRMVGQDTVSRTVTADVVVVSGAVFGPGTIIRFITADVKARVPVRVRYDARTREAEEIVALLGLNDESTDKDLRMFERTEAWFRVMERVLELKSKKTADDFAKFWPVMMGSVKQPGFYSLWVAAINEVGRGRSWEVPDTKTAVVDLFLQEIKKPELFPGTNTANTP